MSALRLTILPISSIPLWFDVPRIEQQRYGTIYSNTIQCCPEVDVGPCGDGAVEQQEARQQKSSLLAGKRKASTRWPFGQDDKRRDKRRTAACRATCRSHPSCAA